MQVDAPDLSPEFFQQHPLLMLVMLGFSLLVLAMLAGAVVSWIVLGIRYAQGKSILPVAPWQARVWGLSDLMIVLILVVGSQFVALAVAVKSLGLPVRELGEDAGGSLPLSALISLGYVCVVGVSTLWLVLRYSVSVRHVGLGFAKLSSTWKVGVIGGIAALPIVYLGNILVSLGMKVEYAHPLLESMKSEPSVNGYLLAVFAAAIAAPLTEEFLFRGLLQGWLQSIPFSSFPAVVLGASKSARTDPENTLFYQGKSFQGYVARTAGLSSGGRESELADEKVGGDGIIEATLVGAEPKLTSNAAQPNPGNSPYEPPPLRGEGELEERNESGQEPLQGIPPIWPSLVAGTLFGLAHWGYGLSFIPLTVLGIFLGLIYRATQSVWPCIIIHFMLNSSSMIALGVMLLVENAGK
ncbi:CPBP family intramembrane glutamic endopeptidase [Aureliella helgolandensis]|uniref:CAAX amino terminal protease self-immunity n=1 Tax=Aureliella helgolandensis TaxID=2527968 RepID=A0A518G8Y9_9BACT|nr:CPBP family intramembrane glutamic endopeptidase [Aureliella helgolandensis]QDV25057.1 CAAX amino terminal protease self- immunity [Aureliella helgolandensis]